MEWYDIHSQSELASTFASDIQSIRQAISDHFGIILRITGCVIVSIGLIFVTAWLLSFVCLTMLPLIILVSYFYLHSYETRSKVYKTIYSKAGNLS